MQEEQEKVVNDNISELEESIRKAADTENWEECLDEHDNIMAEAYEKIMEYYDGGVEETAYSKILKNSSCSKAFPS